MIKLIKFAKNVLSLNKRLLEDEKLQEKEGYSITSIQEGPERYFVYREQDREVAVGVDFSWLNDVRIFTESFRKWNIPYGEELTDFDYKKILNRLVRYFSCWGGEVILDDSSLQSMEEIKESLRQARIPFEEFEDGTIRYTSTVEEERKRKGGFFNR